MHMPLQLRSNRRCFLSTQMQFLEAADQYVGWSRDLLVLVIKSMCSVLLKSEVLNFTVVTSVRIHIVARSILLSPIACFSQLSLCMLVVVFVTMIPTGIVTKTATNTQRSSLHMKPLVTFTEVFTIMHK